MTLRALWAHTRMMKHYFIASALVFIVSMFLGYSEADRYQMYLQEQLRQLGAIANELSRQEQPQLWFFAFIFLNNAIKAVFVVFAGAMFGFLPLLFLVTNGMILGYLGAVQPEGELWNTFLKGILPHGIIEIPALVVACAFGLRFGMLVLKNVLGLLSPRRRAGVSAELRSYIRVTIPLSLLLTGVLFVAALIESTVTYSLMK